jgi:hypothetical protein
MLHDESIDTRTPQLKVFTSTTADDIEAIVRAGWLVADLEPGANGGKVSFECGSHKPQVEYAVDAGPDLDGGGQVQPVFCNVRGREDTRPLQLPIVAK